MLLGSGFDVDRASFSSGHPHIPGLKRVSQVTTLNFFFSTHSTHLAGERDHDGRGGRRVFGQQRTSKVAKEESV